MQPTHEELIEATSHLLPTNRSTSSCCPTPLHLLRLSLANMVLVRPLFHKEAYVNPVQKVNSCLKDGAWVGLPGAASTTSITIPGCHFNSQEFFTSLLIFQPQDHPMGLASGG